MFCFVLYSYPVLSVLLIQLLFRVAAGLRSESEGRCLVAANNFGCSPTRKYIYTYLCMHVHVSVIFSVYQHCDQEWFATLELLYELL